MKINLYSSTIALHCEQWSLKENIPAVMSSPERDADLFDGLSQVMAASLGTIIPHTTHLDLGYQVHFCCITLIVFLNHHGEPLIVNADVCHTSWKDNSHSYNMDTLSRNEGLLVMSFYSHRIQGFNKNQLKYIESINAQGKTWTFPLLGLKPWFYSLWRAKYYFIKHILYWQVTGTLSCKWRIKLEWKCNAFFLSKRGKCILIDCVPRYMYLS